MSIGNKLLKLSCGFLCSFGTRFVLTFTTSQALRAHLITSKGEHVGRNELVLIERYIFRLDKSFFPFKFCLLEKQKHFQCRGVLVTHYKRVYEMQMPS